MDIFSLFNEHLLNAWAFFFRHVQSGSAIPYGIGSVRVGFDVLLDKFLLSFFLFKKFLLVDQQVLAKLEGDPMCFTESH